MHRTRIITNERATPAKKSFAFRQLQSANGIDDVNRPEFRLQPPSEWLLVGCTEHHEAQVALIEESVAKLTEPLDRPLTFGMACTDPERHERAAVVYRTSNSSGLLLGRLVWPYFEPPCDNIESRRP